MSLDEHDTAVVQRPRALGVLPALPYLPAGFAPARIASVQNVAIFVIATYPVLWLVGLGGLFWPILCLTLAFRAGFAPNTIESTGLLVVGQLLILSVPIGVLAFGFEAQRLFSVLANLSVWVATAAMLRIAQQDPTFRTRVLRQLMMITVFQGLVTAVAYVAYPGTLPIPLLHNLTNSLPSGMGAFADNNLVYTSWLDGEAIRSSGVMANPTWAGAIGGLGVLAAIAFRNERSYDWALRVAAVGSGLFAMQLALSRSVQIGLIGSLGLAFAEYLRRRLRLGITPWIIAALATPLVLAVYASRILEWFNSVNAEREGSAESRGAIYALTYDYIRQLPVPVLGYGIKPKSDGLVASVASHSTYLGLTFRAGLVATVVLLLVMAVLGIRTIVDANYIGLATVAFLTLWCIFEDFDGGHLVPLGLIIATAPGLTRRGRTRQALTGQITGQITGQVSEQVQQK